MAEPDALELRGVHAGYDETVVVEDLELSLAPGGALSVIGRNGVGKSTMLATVMGHATLHRGRVAVGGVDVGRLPTYRRVDRGLGLVPQEREIFPSLTVDENLAVAARSGPWSPDRVYRLFPRLEERRAHFGSQLSGGEQQMLAIGRALVGNPRVLLMDEPTEGLAPIIVEELQRVLGQLQAEGSMAMVLVEQNTRVALAFCERCVVMNRGRIVRDGPTEDLRSDPALLDRLIGVDLA